MLIYGTIRIMKDDTDDEPGSTVTNNNRVFKSVDRVVVKLPPSDTMGLFSRILLFAVLVRNGILVWAMVLSNFKSGLFLRLV
jgi:hypothetical protein